MEHPVLAYVREVGVCLVIAWQGRLHFQPAFNTGQKRPSYSCMPASVKIRGVLVKPLTFYLRILGDVVVNVTGGVSTCHWCSL